MKAQNFSFMDFLVPKILSGQKILTSRPATEFRSKLDIGGIMHIYTGLRTKHTQKICDAIVLERVYWEIESAPQDDFIARSTVSPIKSLTWGYFAVLDGFGSYYNFVAYFLNHKYRDLGFYCYRFEIINNV